MKKMDAEVKDFRSHMASSMQQLTKLFQDGVATLESAKKDEKNFE